MPGIRQCALIEAHRPGGSVPAGALRISVTVAPAGRITSVALAELDLGAELAACVRAAVKRLQLAPFAGSPATVDRAVALAPPA